ncbi:MAG TPA: F0F1 ATP synthase subunit B [Steroidobacteraceae bacterium]|nr:F0F1 ATP synthase subunit B [Steroidobacteraceae bacterium]
MLAINATFIGQFIVLLVLLWFIYKFVVPMLAGPIEERQRRIALGLAAAEKGQQDLVQAEQRAEAVVREARERANQIIDQAHRRANEMVEQAKSTAGAEGQRLLAAAQQQIQLEATHVRETLRKDVAELAIETAAKLLEREIDPRTHADLLNKLAAQI